MCPSTGFPCHLSWSQKINKNNIACISFSWVPQHFREFLGQESELISWWGFLSAVSWLLFRSSFSAQLANFPCTTPGPAIRLHFSLKKSSFPSSELCLCFLLLLDIFFSKCFIPLLLSKKLPESLFASPDIMGENLFSWLVIQNPGTKMSDSPRSLYWSIWQTLWENDGFTICSNPRCYHFS